MRRFGVLTWWNFGDRRRFLPTFPPPLILKKKLIMSMGNGRGFHVIWTMWRREEEGCMDIIIIIANNGV